MAALHSATLLLLAIGAAVSHDTNNECPKLSSHELDKYSLSKTPARYYQRRRNGNAQPVDVEMCYYGLREEIGVKTFTDALTVCPTLTFAEPNKTQTAWLATGPSLRDIAERVCELYSDEVKHESGLPVFIGAINNPSDSYILTADGQSIFRPWDLSLYDGGKILHKMNETQCLALESFEAELHNPQNLALPNCPNTNPNNDTNGKSLCVQVRLFSNRTACSELIDCSTSMSEPTAVMCSTEIGLPDACPQTETGMKEVFMDGRCYHFPSWHEKSWAKGVCDAKEHDLKENDRVLVPIYPYDMRTLGLMLSWSRLKGGGEENKLFSIGHYKVNDRKLWEVDVDPTQDFGWQSTLDEFGMLKFGGMDGTSLLTDGRNKRDASVHATCFAFRINNTMPNSEHVFTWQTVELGCNDADENDSKNNSNRGLVAFSAVLGIALIVCLMAIAGLVYRSDRMHSHSLGPRLSDLDTISQASSGSSNSDGVNSTVESTAELA